MRWLCKERKEAEVHSELNEHELLFLKRIQGTSSPPDATPFVSIIIPAKNVAGVLEYCLHSLLQQDYPHSRWEVIMVDHGSSDATIATAQSYAGRLSLKIFTQATGHISGLRNFGARVARGEVFAFLDADCAAPLDWLTRGASLCDSRCITGAFYAIPPQSSWIGRIWYGHEKAEKSGAVSYVPSGSLFVAAESFTELDGFDESLETNEDYEFCQRALQHGFEVTARPELAVTHFGTPQTLGAFYKKHHWHGKHVMAVALRGGKRLHNARAVTLAAYNLIAGVCLLAGIGGALAGRGIVLLLSAATALMSLPVALGTWLSIRRRRWQEIPALAILFIVYGIARAVCLFNLGSISLHNRRRRPVSPITGRS